MPLLCFWVWLSVLQVRYLDLVNASVPGNFLCVNLSEPLCPGIWSNVTLGVSVEVFFGEINTESGGQ